MTSLIYLAQRCKVSHPCTAYTVQVHTPVRLQAMGSAAGPAFTCLEGVHLISAVYKYVSLCW